MPAPAVFVFVAEGCPACHDYLPKFKHCAAGLPCPVGVYDVAKDRHAAKLASSLGVQATPTTIVMTREGRLVKHVGSIGVQEIRRALAAAR